MAEAFWSVAEAKARFSEVMSKAATEGPQHIRRNGRDAAVVVSAEEWAKVARPRSLVDVLTDPSYGVLEPEEAEVLFARDRGPGRGTEPF